MQREKSCGALVLRHDENGKNYILMIRHKAGGHRSFPKGHMEDGETERETALREIREEVGLVQRLIDGFEAVERYPLPRKKDTMKQVTFFLAEYENQEIRFQKEELRGARLMPYEEALQIFQFENTKDVLKKAHAWLMQNA